MQDSRKVYHAHSSSFFLIALSAFIPLVAWPYQSATAKDTNYPKIFALLDKNQDGRIEQQEFKDFFVGKLDAISVKIGEQLTRDVEDPFADDHSARIEMSIPESLYEPLGERVTAVVFGGDGAPCNDPVTQSVDPDCGIQKNQFDKFVSQKLPAPFQPLRVADVLGIEEFDEIDRQVWESKVAQKDALSAIKTHVQIRRGSLKSSDVAKPATLTIKHLGSNDDKRDPDKDSTTTLLKGSVLVNFCGGSCVSAVEDDESSGKGKSRMFGYTSRTDYDFDIFVAVDADVASNRKSNEDEIIHRIGGWGAIVGDPTDFVTQHHFAVTGNFTTGRDYDKEIYGFTAQYSPNIPDLAIGRAVNISSKPVEILFNWRPFLGLDYGDVVDAAGNDKLADQGDFLNLSLENLANLRFGKHVILTPQFTLTQELTNDRDLHSLYGLAVRFLPTGKDDFSIQTSYTRGERAPTFSDMDQIEASIGLKF